jgi:hypothetical protein
VCVYRFESVTGRVSETASSNTYVSVIHDALLKQIASALRRRLEELSRQRRDLEAQVTVAERQTKALRIKIHSPTSSLHAVDERSFSSSTAVATDKRHQEDITMEDG